MLNGWNSLPQSTKNENDQKAIAINNNATQAQWNDGAAFYQYPFSASTLMTLHYAGGLRDAYIAASNAGEVPLVNALLAQKNYQSSNSAYLEPEWVSSDDAKDTYKYPRPYCRLPQINPLDGSGCPTTYGYPSGHTKIAWNEGMGLAIMLPEVAPQILARTAEISNGRIVVGAHYPLDVMAGRAVATRMIAYRMHDDTWKAKFEAARTQLRAALEARCGMTIAACIAKNPPTMSYGDARAYSRDKLTYGFTPVGAAGQAFQAPDFSYELLNYAYPTKTQAEKEAILTSTAIDSGYPLDTTGTSAGTANIGWTRLDLAAALTPPDTEKPVVTWNSPTPNSAISGSVKLSAKATDNVGISSTAFYGGPASNLDGAAGLGSGVYNATTDAYEVTLDTTKLADGNYYVVFDAADLDGNVTRSETQHFTINNTGTPTDTTPPTVTLTSPANNAVLSGTQTITADAGDASGIAKVEFYAGTVKLGEDTVGPYTYSWDTKSVADGNHVLKAVATDNAGNAKTSATVTVTVNNTTPVTQTVTLTAPTASQTVSGASVAVTATVSGTVAKVEFYNGTTKIGQATASPYTMHWDTTALPNGGYNLIAKSFDSASSLIATSPAVMVTVQNQTTTPPKTFSVANNDSATNSTVTLNDSCSEVVSSSKAETPTTLSGKNVVTGIAFTAKCPTAGGKTAVTIRLGKVYSNHALLKVYKTQSDKSIKDITANVKIANITSVGVTLTTIDYTVTDGSTDDSDGTANGTVVDPVYVVEEAAASTPTNPTTNTDAKLSDTGTTLGFVSVIAGILMVTAIVVARSKTARLFR